MKIKLSVGWFSGLFWLAVACSDSGKSTAGHVDAGAGGTTADAAIGDDAGGTSAHDVPTVTAAIGGMGKPFSTSTVDLGAHGYQEEEFFFSGVATAYAVQGKLGQDGKWLVTPTTTAAYKTRALVRRPKQASKFNGTVVVEWLNVSGGIDSEPGFGYGWEELLREGYAYVGVSAQKVGIDGGMALVPVMASMPVVPLKMYDPKRYASLVHPGDVYSYDIYTQAARAIREPGKIDLLQGLSPKRLIAYGESQSAFRLTTYVNGVHPLVKMFDGFFIHSRSAAGAGFAETASTGVGQAPQWIRTDLDEPVFQFQTESDVFGLLAFYTARQPDTDRIRTWEVAGTAHADKHLIGAQASSLGCGMINDGPQHFVAKAALHALQLWLTDGTAPAKGARLQAITSGDKQARDKDGIALGGIRTPAVDVPIATLSGESATPGSLICALLGSSVPFTPAALRQLYPTHQDYVQKVQSAARKTRQAGFILAPEEQVMNAQADAANVPPP